MMLAIIPARKGSKGIKDKNIKMIAGKRMIDWTIDAVRGVMPFVVATDYTELIFDKELKYKTMFRHEGLCTDDSPIIDTVRYVIDTYERENNVNIHAIMLLQPTSPLRTREDIINCYEMWQKNGRNLLTAEILSLKEPNKAFDKNRQYKFYIQRNGAIFIANTDLINRGKLFDESSYVYYMSKSKSIDIDTQEDFFIAESILEKRSAMTHE